MEWGKIKLKSDSLGRSGAQNFCNHEFSEQVPERDSVKTESWQAKRRTMRTEWRG
jgi:hypothetical protein